MAKKYVEPEIFAPTVKEIADALEELLDKEEPVCGNLELSTRDMGSWGSELLWDKNRAAVTAELRRRYLQPHLGWTEVKIVPKGSYDLLVVSK